MPLCCSSTLYGTELCRGVGLGKAVPQRAVGTAGAVLGAGAQLSGSGVEVGRCSVVSLHPSRLLRGYVASPCVLRSLSVGYSTCHWCHVMEEESFKNEEIGEIMSKNFVCIKVDREERPDVDKVYMTFVQVGERGRAGAHSALLSRGSFLCSRGAPREILLPFRPPVAAGGGR